MGEGWLASFTLFVDKVGEMSCIKDRGMYAPPLRKDTTIAKEDCFYLMKKEEKLVKLEYIF